jgi:4-hydroxythreonine-4-phosphate dehydrogenase
MRAGEPKHPPDAKSPIVVTTIGDPCGIGPEVVVKALATEGVPGRTVLIGDAGVVRNTIERVRANLSVRPIQDIDEAVFAPGCVDVLDCGGLKPGDVTPGKLSAACGRAVTAWMDVALGLARTGRVAGVVKGPTNSEAIRLGKAVPREQAAKTYLFLITGPLRVVHLTDQIPLREVIAEVKREKLLQLIQLTHQSLCRWGFARPRIGVAGLNPHAEGAEEEAEIQPAIAQAREEGIDAVGPISPDSLFRFCIEGRFDCVIAHYHDQGHIAVKTWKFAGNCAINLGPPYVRISVAHGTAFDIAGRGLADHMAMTSAMRTAAMLAAGRGFPNE